MELWQSEQIMRQLEERESEVLARAVDNWTPEEEEQLQELLLAVTPSLEEINFN